MKEPYRHLYILLLSFVSVCAHAEDQYTFAVINASSGLADNSAQVIVLPSYQGNYHLFFRFAPSHLASVYTGTRRFHTPSYFTHNFFHKYKLASRE